MLGAEIVAVATEEGAAYGAALLAEMGAGWFPSVEEACRTVVGVQTSASPSEETDRYRERHQQYQTLYPALRDVFWRVV